MIHPAGRMAALAALTGAVACIELSSPTSGLESISKVRAAYPAVVAGDTLRDSLGVARPLTVVGFTGRGDSVAVEGLQFFLPDSGIDARIEDGYLIAGSVLGALRVVGQVPGLLQAPPLTIQVSPRPTSAAAEPAGLGNPATVAPVQYGLADLSLQSVALAVRVNGDVNAAPRAVDGWVVTYAITRQPQARAEAAGLLPAILVAEQGQAVRGDSTHAADTTAAGLAERRVVVRPPFLAAGRDTVVVTATVRDRGADVAGSPIVFRIPIEPRP